MRVVAGECGGRRLTTPPGSATRPTSDRVRESIFNALGSLGVIGGAKVIDLFAGSGALGIEALSRGATTAVFVESDRDACEVITANLASCGLTDRASVVTADASTFESSSFVDVVLADPPYAFDGWEALAGRLDASWLVAESGKEIELGDTWEVIRSRSYGRTWVTIACRLHDD